MSRKVCIDRATKLLLDLFINHYKYLRKTNRRLANRVEHYVSVRWLVESSKNGQVITLAKDIKDIKYNRRDNNYKIVFK